MRYFFEAFCANLSSLFVGCISTRNVTYHETMGLGKWNLRIQKWGKNLGYLESTLPETNIAPENGWLEY